MIKKVVTAAALAFTVLVTPAWANGCFPREKIVDSLSKGYAEQLKGRGIRGQSDLFEVFMANDGATWTILRTFPNGMSCVVASGEHWIDSEITEVKKGVKG